MYRAALEGVVHRVDQDGSLAPFASELGVACGLAFAPDGTLFVGDRSGTIFKVDRGGRAEAFATVPASVAAFHLALAPDGILYVSAPTLSAWDPIYGITPDGTVSARPERFRAPAGGLACDPSGALFVVEACGREQRIATGSRRTARRSSCSPVPASSASRSTGAAASSCAPTRPRSARPTHPASRWFKPSFRART